MLLHFSSEATAQTFDVSGVVKSTSGETLIGSTIRLKGTQKGTVTNEKENLFFQELAMVLLW
ncbi:carboxypeptidase-like regulatory domain-containing protein [Dyadobacter sp. NIV53]|uniref:carboxypeptidase-like regulatory domain-containing protein n=1 Tax=Dyadobacter sp. NIV53 TaxID=2861765 RepID=UPI001E3447EC|nr:carboxypeptidase-like regulatory domain-containing protein [Dyadobacter sp. NIV53]